MGMAPSCHCICPGTGPVSSSSGGGGGGIQTDICNTDYCNSSIVPVTYQMVVTKTGGTDAPACFADYLGTFICTLHQIGDSGICIWRSAEKPMTQTECVETTTECTNRRWEIAVESYVAGPPAKNIKAFSYLYVGASCPEYRLMVGVQDTATTSRDCLAGATVTGAYSGTTWQGVITAV